MAQKVKHLPTMRETWVPSLGQEDPLGVGNGNPLQYSYPENPMDRGAWWATVHGVTKSRTQPSNFTHSLTQRDLQDYEEKIKLSGIPRWH